ncbi:MAG: carboxypeptidase regulatory-like domain-containing protein, partial [Candidatus Binataceae bacterium]
MPVAIAGILGSRFDGPYRLSGPNCAIIGGRIQTEVGGKAHMKRLNPAWGVLGLVLLIATIVMAQGTARLDGQVFDKNGNPYPDVTVEIKNPDNGQTYTTKTDKNGKYVQLGLLNGVYDVVFTKTEDQLTYTVRTHVDDTQENIVNLNFKELLAKSAIANPDAEKKKEEEENKFKAMKQNFTNGLTAMNDAATLRTQWKTAPADQKTALQEKMNADYQTAINSFQLAEQGVGEKEVRNHALVWGHLGEAYADSGRFDDAANAFQKAIDLQPQPEYYQNLGTNLAYAAVAPGLDPKVGAAKIADANAACAKADTLNTTPSATCWK